MKFKLNPDYVPPEDGESEFDSYEEKKEDETEIDE